MRLLRPSPYSVLPMAATAACLWVSIPAFSVTQHRIHLASLKALWRGVAMESVSHLDVGIETDSAEPDSCQLLDIQNPSPDESTSNPLHLYTELPESQQKKFESEIGRPDVFYKGDDFNRNNGDQSHKLTRRLAQAMRDSLDFLDRKLHPGRGEAEVRIQFTRGGLKYDGLMKARAWFNKTGEKKGCTAALYLCPKPTQRKDKEGKTQLTCPTNGWTHTISEIQALVDEAGYAADKQTQFWGKTLKEREKNDIGTLQAIAYPTSGIGKAETLVLVTKETK